MFCFRYDFGNNTRFMKLPAEEIIDGDFGESLLPIAMCFIERCFDELILEFNCALVNKLLRSGPVKLL